jgi:hypothetical protein
MAPRLPQWIIHATGWLAPKSLRADWRREWTAETQHYVARLRDRQIDDREIQLRFWRHAASALADAWNLRARTQLIPRLRASIRSPIFPLAVIVICLALIAGASHGLTTTRSMLDPALPNADRLVLISETGIMLGQRLTVPVPLLEYWKKDNTSFDGLAGYTWSATGTMWTTDNFFDVLGTRPRQFLLRTVSEWKPIGGHDVKSVGVIGRLKEGVSIQTAEKELRTLAGKYRLHKNRYPFPEPDVRSLIERINQPLYSYAAIAGFTMLILFIAATIGILREFRQSAQIRVRFWAYFCAKVVGVPLALLLATWEFSNATLMTVTGGSTLRAEPISSWLFILACGGAAYWCLADQRVRCRACLQPLQYPVRVGCLGAILFNHAGTEFVCCEGHGALYVPELSSDYVQAESWTTLNCT